MEDLKHYKIQSYSLDMTCIRQKVENFYKNDLEAITEAYKLSEEEFNVYIWRETSPGNWMKVAKIY